MELEDKKSEATYIHPSLPLPHLPLSSIKVLCSNVHFIQTKIAEVFLYTLPFPNCLICMYLLFQVGDRDDSNLYINVKLKAAEEVKPRTAILASFLTTSPGPVGNPFALCGPLHKTNLTIGQGRIR